MNKPKTAYIFIDESGTPDLNCKKEDKNSGNMPYCVYAAVVIDEDDLQAARTLHSEIIAKEFCQGFMKSSRISNDAKGYAKTLNVLTSMKQLKHYVIVLVIDKEMLQNHPGFKYTKNELRRIGIFFRGVFRCQKKRRKHDFHYEKYKELS